MQKFEDLNPKEQEEFKEKIAKQIYIEELADIDYMCYYLKINWVDFWEKFN